MLAPLRALGYDTLELFMPLYSCNALSGNSSEALSVASANDLATPRKPLVPLENFERTGRHNWFKQFEPKDHRGLGAEGGVMRFFFEPVVRAVRFAKERLNYPHVVLMGLSGGGWAVTLAAAMLPQHINLTIEVAGSVPKWRTVG